MGSVEQENARLREELEALRVESERGRAESERAQVETRLETDRLTRLVELMLTAQGTQGAALANPAAAVYANASQFTRPEGHTLVTPTANLVSQPGMQALKS